MWEIFEELLKKNGVTAYRVAKETGIATSTFTQWKNGTSKPKPEKLQKIADYFNVSVDYLLGTEKDENVQYYLNDETRGIAQEIFDNKGLKILFDVARKTEPKRLEAYVKFLKELSDKENTKE